MSTDFDPKKGDFGIGNGINEYNDQDDQAKQEKPLRQPREPEPIFAGKPLSYFDRFATANDLKGLDGIGEAKANEIIAARHKRDRK